jgi:autophagy-related protein 2
MIVTSDWKNDRPLAQSTATLLAASTISNVFDHLQPSWTVSCPLIRVEVRAHLDENIESIGDTLGLSTRSGIIAIDFIEVHLEQADCKHEHASSVRFTEPAMGSRTEIIPTFTYPQQQTKLTMSELHISHLTPQAAQDTQFATISPLRSKDQAESAVRPTLTYAAGTPNALDMLMPSIELEMSKGLLTYLEFLADDLSLWNARVHGWYEHISAQKTTNALRILGSRFFGSRYSYSTLSDSSVSTEIGRDKGTNRPTLNALIHEATLRIYLPAMDTQEQQAQSTAEHLEDPGHLTCHANEIQAQFDGAYSETASSLRLTLAGLSVRHSARQEIILEQTLGNPLGQLRRPVLNIQVISTVERDTSFRGSQINVSFCNSTISYDGDVSFIRQLQAFAKAPQGIFEHVEPNEVTRLSLQIEDVTFLLCPKRTTARAAIVVGLLTLRSKVISDYPRNATKLTLNNSGVYIGETLSEKNNNDIRARRVTELWQSRGLSRVLQASGVEVVSTKSTLTLPEIDLHVNGGQVEGMACADTAKVLQAIAVEFTDEIDRSSKSAKPDRQRSQTDLRKLVGVFNEVEDHSYSKTLEDVSDMDLLEDDVPYHLNAYGEKVVGNVNRGQTILQNDLVTVRLLDTERGIQPQSGFFSDPNLHVERRSKGAPSAPHFRLAIRNVDAFLHLYGGFDAESTRKAFEDEAKRVRRRLQRIKQMLDQGQIPDDSVEEATATLFDSMHVSLPKGRTAADMNATELMQVVDEEMDDQTETASTASTWKQFVPGRVDSPTFSSKRKRSKLARSKDSMIEFEFKGIQVNFDSFDDGDADVQSKLDLRVRSLRILDHIKTSTWQTFLTGMSSSALRLSESQPDMVRLELTSVLSTSGRSDNELRCRSRISPLRLHVDQDALDFLKKFFMLEIPGQPAPAASSSNIELGPFIQHAEVFPILLKLDYKPKRVDYQLLRQGKTIEMMNFFNFEASEITLRHITLRGVMGWPALFDMLNDMWTPDVKANQLADVLSGITPIRSLVNVGNGVADLILLPIEHYQRDGRLGRGLKEGAKRFVKTTALEAARVGARLATGTQVILERTEHVLGGGTRQMDEQRGVVTGSRSPMRQSDEESEEETEGMTEQPDQISRYASRPETMRQALGEAQRGLSRGLNEAAQTILAVPMEVYDRQAGEGRGRPVVRAVPIAILRGAAGASEAISKTLQGVERGLAGSRFAEAEEIEAKYKKRGKEKDTAKR